MVAAFVLADLVDHELSAVCFVRDFVEFQFDGPILRALSDPVIHIGARSWHFPLPGTRDALCSVIGGFVTSASERATKLVVEFGEQCQLKHLQSITRRED